ncbi:hypothetical protein [Bradyrhizobium sp. Gha]|uniref:hypothetical protein n=1 Tax=Bradyrhizobium sp. Gha TaxID=1855318 RepID=UPI0008F26C80|nr:hypothetical protein [Bradyrhizobium sp. Gha]SFI62762.1 hypothetical protein SAMN05216525_11198 [Bradyrhizobium sp. Gha]
MSDDAVAKIIDEMSLPELVTLQADLLAQVASGKMTPEQANAISAIVEKRIEAVRRETRSH